MDILQSYAKEKNAAKTRNEPPYTEDVLGRALKGTSRNEWET